MILGVEIAMLVVGLLAIFRGRMTISKNKVVTGIAARLLGLVALTPLPVAFATIALYVAVSGPGDPERFVEDNKLTIMLIEAGVVIGIAIVVFGMGAAIGHPPEPKPEDDDEDEDDSPRRRRSRMRDDEDDDQPDDDDDEDRSRRRRRRDDDD
jgi:hypothetical protein